MRLMRGDRVEGGEIRNCLLGIELKLLSLRGNMNIRSVPGGPFKEMRDFERVLYCSNLMNVICRLKKVDLD